MSLLGWLTILYGSSSHLSAILCFPSKATILTSTLSPDCRMAPRTFLSYPDFCYSCAVLADLDAGSYAFFNLSFMVSTYFVDGSFFPSTSKSKAMSTGNLGDLPNIRKYGENSVVVCRVQLYAWTSPATCDFQSFFGLESNVPSILSSVRLKRYVMPFPIGW